MKGFLRISLSTLLISFSMVVPAMAAEDVFNRDNVCGTNGEAESTLCVEAGKTQKNTDNGIFGQNGILNKAANLLLVIIGIAATFMVIIGGISYSLSGGDSARINKAKDMIIYAFVGIAVGILAKGIIIFVIDRI